jgi:hypothetical protein
VFAPLRAAARQITLLNFRLQCGVLTKLVSERDTRCRTASSCILGSIYVMLLQVLHHTNLGHFIAMTEGRC